MFPEVICSSQWSIKTYNENDYDTTKITGGKPGKNFSQ